jgi:hypothetical protein
MALSCMALCRQLLLLADWYLLLIGDDWYKLLLLHYRQILFARVQFRNRSCRFGSFCYSVPAGTL